MNTITLRGAFHRVIPDPIHAEIMHHEMWVRVQDLPRELLDHMDANARIPAVNSRSKVHKEIQDSLLERGDLTPGIFHLKNGGITVVADSAIEMGSEEIEGRRKFKTWVYDISEDKGVLNGGHTTKIIIDSLSDGTVPFPENFVKVSVRLNIDADWIPEMSQGLNTSIQVKDSALLELERAFDWIKSALEDKPYITNISFKPGDSGGYDISDLVALMTLFNPPADSHARIAYTSKGACITEYSKSRPSYERLKNVLPDILDLHDTIHEGWSGLYNTEGDVRPGALKIARPTQLFFRFPAEKIEQGLHKSALYPMLGTFRALLELDKHGGHFQWKIPFKDVRKVWKQVAKELVREAKDQCQALGYNLNALGKSAAAWESLQKTFENTYTQRQKDDRIRELEAKLRKAGVTV